MSISLVRIHRIVGQLALAMVAPADRYVEFRGRAAVLVQQRRTGVQPGPDLVPRGPFGIVGPARAVIPPRRPATFLLHEGITDPGGTWNTPDHITPALASSVAAAIPGGFRTNSGPVGNRGGYYDQGGVAEPLRTGAASLVIATDGTVSIGQWGRDVAMSPTVRSVRQNLDLLVDGGTVNPTCASGSTAQWGFGVTNNAFVPRTGIGQRADGALVFVNSPVTLGVSARWKPRSPRRSASTPWPCSSRPST